ncbi:MAG: tyrosine-type recombinase/integrase [Thermodesulfobacteriota bacterium]
MSEAAKVCWDTHRNHWCVRLIWQGKRYYFSKYLGQVKTGSDPSRPCQVAQRIASDINAEIDKGIFNPARHQQSKPLHVAQYYQRWIATLTLEAATLKDYRNSFKNHIIPRIGDKFLLDINYEVLKNLQNGIQRSSKGKKNVMGALHKLLGDAFRSGHIPAMPVFPSFTGRDTVVDKVPEWINADTQAKVLAEIPPADRHIFRFMFLTGCRVSEARAFRWTDIKPDHIVFSVTFDPHENLKPIKNKRERKFPITAGLRELFSDMPRNLSPFCFLNSRTGRPHTKNINRDTWNPACQKAMGRVFPLNNAGRHSFANQLLEATDNISLVSKALGHSHISVTKKHYGDHSVESMRQVIDNVRPIKRS